MPRKGLGIAEALTLFEELPSDPESEISSDDSEKEVNVPFTANDNLQVESDEGSEDEDNIDINLPGPSRVTQINWNRRQKVKKSIPEFSEEYGPKEDITLMDDINPINIFMSFLTIAFIKKLVFETNLYATQKGKPFSPIFSPLQDEMIFIGINMLMGIKKLLSYRDFWSTNEILHDSYVSKQMAVNKFTWMLGNLHLNDNSLMPKREVKNFDKLYKLRPLLTHLSDKFKSLFRPGKNQSIDESMICFKGRSSLK